MHPVQPEKQWLCNDSEETPVHDLLEFGINFLQNVDIFRADE